MHIWIACACSLWLLSCSKQQQVRPATHLSSNQLASLMAEFEQDQKKHQDSTRVVEN